MNRLHLIQTVFVMALIAVTAAACRNGEGTTPPPSVAVAGSAATPTAAEPQPLPQTVTLAATHTSEPTLTPPPSPTATPSITSRPATNTPESSATPDETPTETPTDTPQSPIRPPATAIQPSATVLPPTLSPIPTLGNNLLPNPSFEEGHYLQNNIPELQLPNGWRADYQEGPTGFGGQPWDVFVRPETRVLSTASLPPQEHALYIFDGSQTVKIFKGAGAVSARLLTDVDLQPGTYVVEVNFFADVFENFADGQKIAPADPYAAEAMVFAGNTGTGWVTNKYLARNTLTHRFTIDTPLRMTVGVGFRGRYAIQNNGWFVDDLSLRQLQ